MNEQTCRWILGWFCQFGLGMCNFDGHSGQSYYIPANNFWRILVIIKLTPCQLIAVGRNSSRPVCIKSICHVNSYCQMSSKTFFALDPLMDNLCRIFRDNISIGLVCSTTVLPVIGAGAKRGKYAGWLCGQLMLTNVPPH